MDESKAYLRRVCISLSLLMCILLSLTVTIQMAEAANVPPQHVQQVTLSIILGRIYFKPNTVHCSHLSKPCFNLKYVSNDGVRPVWLDGSREYILKTGQTIPFLFPLPGMHLFTLFQHSMWWKVKVIVS